MTIAPKALLRHPSAVSSLADMAPGTTFKPVLGEAAAHPGPAAADTTRMLVCSGKLHLELAAKRTEAAGKGAGAAATTGIMRVEELAPFPTANILSHLAQFPKLKEVVWVQEEPANAGAWSFAEAHLTPALKKAGLPSLKYVGRPALATPAVGLSKYNKAQQDHLLARAMA